MIIACIAAAALTGGVIAFFFLRSVRAFDKEKEIFRFIYRYFGEREEDSSHEELLTFLCGQLRAEGVEFSILLPDGSVRCVSVFPYQESRKNGEEWKGEWTENSGGLDDSPGYSIKPDSADSGHVRVLIPIRHDNEIAGSLSLVYKRGTRLGKAGSLFSDISGILSPILAAALANRKLSVSRESLIRAYRYTEEKLMNTVAEIHDMIIFVRDDAITYINRAGIEFLGYSEPWEILGRKEVEFYLFPEDREELIRQLESSGKVKNFELILKKKNGGKTFGLLSAVAVLEGGKVREIISITKDVNERMETENKIRVMNLDLTKANRELKETHLLMLRQEKLAAVGQLAAGIAHEINTPLGYVKSNVSAMSRFLDSLCRLVDEAAGSSGRGAGRGGTGDSGGRGMAGKADDLTALAKLSERYNVPYIEAETPALVRETEEGIERIVRIINSLLRFSRAEGKEEEGTFDLNRCILDTITIAWNELKHVTEVRKEFGDIPPVTGDSGEIGQVILNVLVNAAQAIREQKRDRPGTIVVETYMDQDYIRCRISDDGPGIPKDVQMRIFDAFYTTKPVGYGTGLGLSISHDIIVKKHHGTIEVVSEPDKGASFLISLPRTPAAD